MKRGPDQLERSTSAREASRGPRPAPVQSTSTGPSVVKTVFCDTDRLVEMGGQRVDARAPVHAGGRGVKGGRGRGTGHNPGHGPLSEWLRSTMQNRLPSVSASTMKSGSSGKLS